MNDKPIKKMNREELLELLIRYTEEKEALEQRISELQAQLAAVQKKLDDRAIDIARAGSLAEASLQLSGVFEAAQRAADQYLENIRRMYPAKNAPDNTPVQTKACQKAGEDDALDAQQEQPRRRKRGMGL